MINSRRGMDPSLQEQETGKVIYSQDLNWIKLF